MWMKVLVWVDPLTWLWLLEIVCEQVNVKNGNLKWEINIGVIQ
jgi:hypothetical protein